MSRAAPLLVVLMAATGGCAGEVRQPATPVPALRSAVAPPSLSDQLAAAIEASDLEGALSTLCAAYAEAGMPCAETVYIKRLAPTDVMARAGFLHNITMPPMPTAGGGFAYWDNWSAILSDGAWQPRALFKDDEEARRVANMLLVSVLAHELGHHVASRFGCSRFGPQEELQADELSVPLVVRLATGPLGDLHARMRTVADAMIAAVPAETRIEVPRTGDLRAWVASQAALPKAVPSYVTLHLSRQRRLLEGPAPEAVRRCLDADAARLRSRRVRPGRVRTLARTAALAEVTDLFALDPAGRPWAVTIGPHVTVRGGDGSRPHPAFDLPEGASDLVALAVLSEDRLAVADFERIWILDHGTLREVGRSVEMPVALAFDEAGRLFAAYADEKSWRVVEVGVAAPPSAPRVELIVQHGVEGWEDGSPDRARASPTLFTVRGGEVVFVDASREAVRAADSTGVVTLAGSRPGRADGDAEQASFFGIEAIGRLASGDVVVAEHDFPSGEMVVRVIERAALRK